MIVLCGMGCVISVFYQLNAYMCVCAMCTWYSTVYECVFYAFFLPMTISSVFLSHRRELLVIQPLQFPFQASKFMHAKSASSVKCGTGLWALCLFRCNFISFILFSLSYLYITLYLCLCLSFVYLPSFWAKWRHLHFDNSYHRAHVCFVCVYVCTCAPIFILCVCICICTISLERFVFAPVDTLLPLKINFFFDRDINIIMFKVYSFFSFSPFFSFSRSCHCLWSIIMYYFFFVFGYIG